MNSISRSEKERIMFFQNGNPQMKYLFKGIDNEKVISGNHAGGEEFYRGRMFAR